MKVLLITLLMISPLQAISLRTPGVIAGDPSTLTQDRFDANTPSAAINNNFNYSAFDFSGVGWDSANSSKSITMISDRHFVAARHHSISGNVSFLTSAGVVSYAVSTQTIINNPAGAPGSPTGVSDLRIGTLAAPIDLVSTGINFYPVLDQSLSPVGNSILIYGQKGRVGQSFITQEGNITVSGIQGRTTVGTYNIAAGGPNDAFFTVGDSGGPSFLVDINGNLILSGVHWAVGNNANSANNTPATQRFNFDTKVNHYIDQAESQVANLEFTIVPAGTRMLPEPSSSMLIMMAGLALTFRRNK